MDPQHREKAELLSQLADFKKLSETLSEKNSLLQSKENEMEKMRKSYSELEEFIESLKIEKDQSLELFKKQIFELNSELESYKELYAKRTRNSAATAEAKTKNSKD